MTKAGTSTRLLFDGSSSLPAVTLCRSERKTVALQITREGNMIVRAPYRVSEEELRRFVCSHDAWIRKNLAKQKERLARYPAPTAEELACLTEKAKAVLPSRVAHFAAIMGLTPDGLSIGHAKSRFGSCDRKNRLRFSCLLMRYPPEAIDYVVVHELAHIVHKNHGKAFYALIAAYLPDYKTLEALLR